MEAVGLIYRRLALRGLQGLLLTAPLCIFLYSVHVLFPFVTPKAWFFSLVVELSLPVAVLVWCWYPERRLEWKRFLPFLFFLGAMAIAATYAENPLRAWFSTAERMLGAAGWLHAAAWGGFVALAFRSPSERRVFSGWMLGIAVILSIMGFWEWQFGGFLSTELHRRIWATTGNANILAAYLACAPFFALPFVPVSRRRPALTAGLCVAVACILTALFLTDSRAGLLGLVAGSSAVFLVFLWGTRGRWYSKYLWGATGALVVVAILAVGVLFGVTARGGQIITRLWESGLYDRVLLGRAAWQGIQLQPYFGVGAEQFFSLFNKHYRSVDYIFLQDARWSDQSHNLTLDVLLSSGLLGALAYVVLLGMVGWGAVRSVRDGHLWPSAAWVGGSVAYLATHQLSPQTFGPHMLFFLFATYAVQTPRWSTREGSVYTSVFVWIASGLAVGGAIVAAFFFVLIPAQANIAVIRATRLLYTGQVQRAIVLYDTAFQLSPLYRPELRFYTAKEVAEVVDAIHPPDAGVAYAWSLRQWEQNMQDRPQDVIDRLSFAQLALTLGEEDPILWERGWEILLPALERSPGRPQIRYTLARLALARHKPEAAADMLRAPVFALEREAEWWWLQARIAHMRGESAEVHHFLPMVKSYYRFLGAAELAEVVEMVGDTDPAFVERVRGARPDGE